VRDYEGVRIRDDDLGAVADDGEGFAESLERDLHAEGVVNLDEGFDPRCSFEEIHPNAIYYH
jgi:hypothetical protein